MKTIEKIFKKYDLHFAEVIVFLYTSTHFLKHITRYKNAITIVFFLTGIYYIFAYRPNMRAIFKTTLFWSMIIFCLSEYYMIFLSIEPYKLAGDMKRPVLQHILAMSLFIPILLHRTSPERSASVLLYGFSLGIFIFVMTDVFLYANDYLKEGLKYGQSFKYRFNSNFLTYLFPFSLLFLKEAKPKNKKWAILLILGFSFSIFGTLARGAWLACFIALFLWCLYFKNWKLLLSSCLIASLLALGLKLFLPNTMLSAKLQQTDSSSRWDGGVQTAAFDIIKKNPWIGYGPMREHYERIYKEELPSHPHWKIRDQVMGTHNIFLTAWVESGIFGLLATIFVIIGVLTSAYHILKEADTTVKHISFAILLSFLSGYVIRGFFESQNSNELGWIIGFLLYFQTTHSKKESGNIFST